MLIPPGGRAWRIVFGGLLAAAAADAFAPAGGRLALPRSVRLSPATAARRTCMAGGAAMPDGGAAPFGTQADLQDTVDRAAQGQSWKRKVTLLGSTGSIGTQTLDIVEYLPDRFEIEGLAAGGNVKLLAEQIKKFNPKIVSVGSDKALSELKDLLSGWKGKMPELCVGNQGLVDVAKYGEVGFLTLCLYSKYTNAMTLYKVE
jgi:1-deoxy-D-xylulose-5-phosphate reductoisomerase